MSYQELLNMAEYYGLNVWEAPLRVCDGLICGNDIAIRSDIDDGIQKGCVLAEELGHYATTVGDILSSGKDRSGKQELKARRWAHGLLLPISRLYEAQEAGCQNRFEVAEYLGVTEDFLQEALDNYQLILGKETDINGFHISFDPLYIKKTA